MNHKNRLLPLAFLSWIGLIAPPARSAIGVKPDAKAPTAMFIAPADFELRGLSVPATVPGAFANAQKASIAQAASNPAVVLRRGSEIAVLPQAFTQGSKAVLVHTEGKVSLLSLTEDTVSKLENDLNAGNIASAHQTLFDGAKTAAASDSDVVHLDARTSAANQHLAETVVTLMARITSIPPVKGGFRKGFATPLYVKREVSQNADKASETVRRLILAGEFTVAADLVKGIAPEKLWAETKFYQFDDFLTATEVDNILAAIVVLLTTPSGRP